MDTLKEEAKRDWDMIRRAGENYARKYKLPLVMFCSVGEECFTFGDEVLPEDCVNRVKSLIDIDNKARGLTPDKMDRNSMKMALSDVIVTTTNKRKCYTKTDIPIWWEKTGIDFISPNNPGEGNTPLQKEELKTLLKSWQEYTLRKHDRVMERECSTDKTPAKRQTAEAGACFTRHSTAKMFKHRELSMAGRDRVKCKRVLFNNNLETVGESVNEPQQTFVELLSPIKESEQSAKDKVLGLCDQREEKTFTAALSRRMISKCKKIGEGLYGEVFRSQDNTGDTVVIKIIPIEGDVEVNGEQQKTFSEVLPEIVIAKELSNLRHAESGMTTAFCQVNTVSCIKGKYASELIREWGAFRKNKGSENDRPDVFQKNQLYIAFVFADCGTDLESYTFETIRDATSCFKQIVHGLAAAEHTMQFEHRDMHWGNILIKKHQFENKTVKDEESYGIQSTIIDFTMSRLTKDGCTAYINIPDDDTLFQGQGDYQFDIYREMKKENRGNWEKFSPRSNVLWLHYLADKLINAKKYPDESRAFKQFMPRILEFRSAYEMVKDSTFLRLESG